MKTFLKKLFGMKKASTNRPSLEQGFYKLNQLCEDYENIRYYLVDIEGFKIHPETKRYLDVATYNLCSARDEIQAAYIKTRETAQWEKISKRVEQSNSKQ